MDDYVVKDLEDVRKVDKVRVKHATVAKKVDVKRLKKDLWRELEMKTELQESIDVEDGEKKESLVHDADIGKDPSDMISFQEVVKNLEEKETQEDVSLAFYFICILHLANEKSLKLENGEHGLNDFIISRDNK
jgi:condensin complex subunit 2